MKAGRHNDEPLQPHTDIHKLRGNEQHHRVRAEAPDPHHLRSQPITQNEDPVHLPVRTKHPVDLCIALEHVACVEEAKERLHEISVENDHARREHHFAHVFKMLDRNEIFEIENLAERNRER